MDNIIKPNNYTPAINSDTVILANKIKVLQPKDKYLKVDKYLSEFKTQLDKEAARNNLDVYSKEEVNSKINISGDVYISDVPPEDDSYKLFVDTDEESESVEVYTKLETDSKFAEKILLDKASFITDVEEEYPLPETKASDTATKALQDWNGNNIVETYATKNDLSSKLNTLVSGTNIKTVNNQELLGQGNITFKEGIDPDDEDIINSNNKLKFADRAYDLSLFIGKGYKILRKNITEGKNILTQDMINQPNTIYEIRYDFDLNGNIINVLEGCTLNFLGGSFINGTINVNKTECIGNIYPSLLCNISGTLASGTYYAKIFGILPNTNIASRINTITLCLNGSTLVFERGLYIVEEPILLYPQTCISGIWCASATVYSEFITTEDFIEKYSNRGVIETYNFANNQSDIYAHGIGLKNIYIRNRLGNFDYGLIVYQCGELTIVDGCFIYGALKANYYYCGYMAVGRITNCSAWKGAIGWLFDKHPNEDGLVNNGGSCSLINCSGDSYSDCCIKVTGAQNITLVSQKVEDVTTLCSIETYQKSSGNIIPIITFIGGRVLYKYPNNNDNCMIRGLNINTYISVNILYMSSYSLTYLYKNEYRNIEWINSGNEAAITVSIDESNCLHIDTSKRFNGPIICKNSILISQADVPNVNTDECLKLTFNTANLTLLTDRDRLRMSIRPSLGEGLRLYDGNPIVEQNKLIYDEKAIGTTDNRNNLYANNIANGFKYFNTDKNIIETYYNNKWFSNGYNSEFLIKGTSEQRPSLTISDEGFEYYDSTLKKKVLWNGTEWTNLDGTSLI